MAEYIHIAAKHVELPGIAAAHCGYGVGGFTDGMAVVLLAHFEGRDRRRIRAQCGVEDGEEIAHLLPRCGAFR